MHFYNQPERPGLLVPVRARVIATKHCQQACEQAPTCCHCALHNIAVRENHFSWINTVDPEVLSASKNNQGASMNAVRLKFSSGAVEPNSTQQMFNSAW